MKIKVLNNQVLYRDCPIAIRNIGENFEYITCINNLIYSSFVVARKSFLRRILFLDYSKKQISGITKYVTSMAETTIDTVLDDKQPAVKEDTAEKRNIL